MTNEHSKIIPQPPIREDNKASLKQLTQSGKLFTTLHLEIFPEPKLNNAFTSIRDIEVYSSKSVTKFFTTTKELGNVWKTSLKADGSAHIIIVGKHQKNKYQVKDMKGYVLKTYLNGSNLKCYLTKNDVNENDPDLISVSELPDTPDTINDLLASINYEKKRPKSKEEERRGKHRCRTPFPRPLGT